MTFKRFPDNHYERNNSSHLYPQFKKEEAPKTTHYEEIKTPKKRRVIPFFLFFVLFFCFYFVWDTFFRYESYGIVESNKIGIYSPYKGIIDWLGVVEGQRVNNKDIVLKIVNKETLRDLERVKDEKQITQSEIISRKSELRWKVGNNRDSFYRAKSELTNEEGQLLELKSKVSMLRSNLERLKTLRQQGAVSVLELDRAQAEYAGVIALINGKTNTIGQLRTRIVSSEEVIEDTSDLQMSPLIQRLTYLQNEEKRLLEKIEEGTVRSPVTGVVSTIEHVQNEYVDQTVVFYILEENTTQLVLYYRTTASLPPLNDTIDIWVPSLNKTITAVVEGYSKDTFFAPDQIKREYFQDERLIKVFLKPQKETERFVVGGVIKKTTRFESFIYWLYLQVGVKNG